MMKRMLCLLLCLTCLISSAGAEGWLTDSAAPDAVQKVTDSTVYDAADAAGTVVNAPAPGDPTYQEQVVYSFTPMDVVLVVDVSGSMDRADGNQGRTLLQYARDAAESFAKTLLSINPASRIAVVAFDNTAYTVCGLYGLGDQAQLLSAIGRLYGGGTTNTGGGYANAADLLDNSAMDGRRRMVLMITDGQANEGQGDPETYAINQGKRCAAMGAVYTIGMVGGLGSTERKSTRKVLNAGYETRYFEVDFDKVADAGAMITMLTSAIAVSASSAETVGPDGEIVMSDSFQLAIGPGFEARVVHASGEYLSSYQEDWQETASFGSMTQVDDSKYFVMVEDDYHISLKSSRVANTSYSFTALRGNTMKEETLAQFKGWSHPSMALDIDLKDGRASLTDVGYDCLNVHATDFAGNPTIGLERAATAKAKANGVIKAAPASDAPKVYQLKKNDHVQIVARNVKTGHYFVIFTDKDGKLSRGWIPISSLSEAVGYVPNMVWLEGEEYTVAADTTSRHAPEHTAAKAYDLKAGATVQLMHAERAKDGEEWAYVSIPNKKSTRYAYVPASALQGWQTTAPEGFRLGQNIQPLATELSFPKLPIGPGQKLKVYSGPSTKSWRGAKGKAMVNTNGGLYAMGWVDNGWLLVQYETNSGNRRTGYVSASDIKITVPSTPVVVFDPKPATITDECFLTDDPVNLSEQIATMKRGAKVTYLGSYTFEGGGEPLDYIETKVNKKLVRAFIPQGCLEIN